MLNLGSTLKLQDCTQNKQIRKQDNVIGTGSENSSVLLERSNQSVIRTDINFQLAT
jgi:hypothetical protein